MSNRNNKNSRYAPKPFETFSGDNTYTRIFSGMMKSIAYKSLSLQARELYRILKSEYKGEINDKRFQKPNTVICPYDKMIEQGFRRGSIARYLNELELMGFIKSESGGFNNASRYILIEDWKQITAERAKEIQRISTKLDTRRKFDEYLKDTSNT